MSVLNRLPLPPVLPSADERLTTRRQDLVAVVLGTWLVLGVFVDGWAHVNKTALETFFTPWHGILYTGAAASFGYVAYLVRRSGGVPPGYLPALLGGPLFLLGGAGDYLWHAAFGLEVGIDALLSPTHLVLLASGLMVVSTGWSVDLRRGPDASGTGVVSLVLATALSAFFLLYTSAFTEPYAAEALTTIPEGAPGHEEAEVPAMAGLAGYLITTVLLLVPALLLARRRRLPFGSATALVAVVATLTAAVVEFRQPLLPLAALLAGLAVDVALVRTTRSTPRTRVLAVALVLPLALWPLQLLGVALSEGVGWPVELWTGVVVLSAAVAGVLGVLSLGPVDRTVRR